MTSMTPEERDLLTRFLDDLGRSRPQAKDAEASVQIETALRSNPDAAYVLVQHAILSDHALQDAQARIADLEDQLRGGPPREEPQQPGFLGALFGKGAPPNPPGVGQAGPWGARGGAVPPTAPGTYPAGAYPASYEPPAQQGGPFSGGGGLGGFLRNAGTTAAGVAGGAFLFEGLSGLFGHRPGFGGGYGFEGGAPVENTVINEYGGGERDFARSDDVDYDSDNGDLTGDDYS